MMTNTRPETDKPPGTRGELETAEQWAALGRRIAIKMASGWGAEWRPHYWDTVEEKDAEYRVAHAAHLSPLWDAGKYDEEDALRDACRAAWREVLTAQLCSKRGSRFAYHLDETKPVHLLLADGTTITGSLTRDASRFVFRLTARGAERTFPVLEDTEFMLEPSKLKNVGARTDRLVLRHEDSGYRHWLGRRDVHCGHGITLALPDGRQIGGRYECNLSRDDSDPIFYFTLAGGIEGTQRIVRCPYDAEFVMEGRAL